MLALGHDATGTMMLWAFDGVNGWRSLQAIPDATAMTRDGDEVIIARGTALEIRSIDDPLTTKSTVELKWKGAAPPGSIGAIDRLRGGTVAISLNSCGSGGPQDLLCSHDVTGYALVQADGSATFVGLLGMGTAVPLVAWLDDQRLLVVVNQMAQSGGGSAIVASAMIYDVKTRKLTDARLGEPGCFALSADRQTIVTERPSSNPPLYESSVSELGSHGKSTPILSEEAGGIESVALDPTGSRLLAVEAVRNANDDVVGRQQQVFEKTASGWALVATSPMPFVGEDPVAQRLVWLPDPLRL